MWVAFIMKRRKWPVLYAPDRELINKAKELLELFSVYVWARLLPVNNAENLCPFLFNGVNSVITIFWQNGGKYKGLGCSYLYSVCVYLCEHRTWLFAFMKSRFLFFFSASIDYDIPVFRNTVKAWVAFGIGSNRNRIDRRSKESVGI